MIAPSVRVVMVNYNAGTWLQRSVGSALQAQVDNVTLIDNASSDNSIVELEETIKDPRLVIVRNTENRGFAAANNQVLSELEHDFAVLLNPDCEMHADTLAAILSAFQTRPKLGLASCRIVDEQGFTHKTSKRRFPTPWSALVRMLQLNRLQPNNERFADFDYAADSDHEFELVDAVSGAFMVVRNAALQQVGVLDDAYFMHCEDLDWCKRFALAGWQVGYVGDATVVHAKGVSSKSRPIGVLWNLHSGMARFFDKFYRADTNPVLRWLVRLGIFMSFVLRAAVSLVRGLLR